MTDSRRGVLYTLAMSGSMLAAHVAGGHETILTLILICLLAGTLAAARKRPPGRKPTAPASRQTGADPSDASSLSS